MATRGRVQSSSLFEALETNRGFAGALALGGLAVVATFWGLASFSPDILRFGEEAGGIGGLVPGLFVWFVVFMGTAEGTLGALSLFVRRDETSSTSYDVLSGQAPRLRATRRRMRVLVALLAAVVNTTALWLFLQQGG